jgi:multidrug efflux pump subunit AcrA (membrane-fusion protein)
MSVDPKAVARQLQWGAGWLSSLIPQERSQAATRQADRAAVALDMMAVAGEHRRSREAAQAIANELAGRLRCDRVSIGLIRRGQMRLTAISHTAWYHRKSQQVDAIENAMEEALDQNTTVVVPAPAGSDRRIVVAHQALLKSGHARVAASTVLASRGRALGAITLERQRDEPFAADELKLCEMLAALIGPVLDLQIDRDRWLGGAWIDAATDGLKLLFGRRRPAVKLAALAAVVIAMFMTFAEIEHRVAAKSVIEGIVQTAAVAPFDGFIKAAPLRAGDTVHEGDVLAVLDDRELILDRLKWSSEREKLVQKRRDALAKHDRTALSVLEPQIQQAQSQLALAEDKLARTRIRAPFDGVIVAGDLSQMLGSPVEKGKTLFEVAPLDGFRVVVQVDERDIGYVRNGQDGHLALAGIPARPLPITVTKLTPVATSEEGRNYFRVEASVGSTEVSIRPGMEGIAKLDIGQRSLVWVWTHSLVEWAQLMWWKWVP